MTPTNSRLEYMRCWRAANPDKVRAIKRRYRQAHREKMREETRQWRKDNREKVLKQAAAWRENNPIKMRDSRRKWREKNPDILREQANRRRARQAGSFVAPVDRAEVIERDNWICQLCHEPVERDSMWPHPLSVSLDHIIPLAAGGTHEPSNVQLAHLVCNQRKGARCVQPGKGQE